MLLVLLVLLVEVVVREREEEARGRILSPEGIAILSRLRQPPVSTGLHGVGRGRPRFFISCVLAAARGGKKTVLCVSFLAALEELKSRVPAFPSPACVASSAFCSSLSLARSLARCACVLQLEHVILESWACSSGARYSSRVVAPVACCELHCGIWSRPLLRRPAALRLRTDCRCCVLLRIGECRDSWFR